MISLPDGAELAVDEAGAPGRTPVVLVHAGVCDRRMWDVQWPALAEGRRVVRYDMRGFGGSPAAPGSYAPAADLIALLDALGIDAAHLPSLERLGVVTPELVRFVDGAAGRVT